MMKIRSAFRIAFALLPFWIPLFVQAQSGTWRPVKGPGPAPRWGHVMVYDPDEDRVLLWGGASADLSVLLGDLWAFSLDTETWQRLDQGTEPPAPRFTPGAVWDRSGRRMILFGGLNNDGILRDAWAFSSVTQSWSGLPDGPSARFDVTMLEGPDAAWVYGGFDYEGGGEHALADLWEFDLQGDTWRQLPDGLERPARRTSPAAGYDAVSNALYVFAGHDETPPPFQDTWSYDLTAESWQRLSPAGELPDALAHQAYAFDPECRALYMMGGDRHDLVMFSSLWALTLDPLQFMRIKTTPNPPPRIHALMVRDQQGRLILFGGLDPNGVLGDTWIFENSGQCP